MMIPLTVAFVSTQSGVGRNTSGLKLNLGKQFLYHKMKRRSAGDSIPRFWMDTPFTMYLRLELPLVSFFLFAGDVIV